MKNDPAFPQFDGHHSHMEGPHSLVGGLSKREYFAGLAMQGLLSGTQINESDLEYTKRATNGEAAAFIAIQWADALIAELEKTK